MALNSFFMAWISMYLLWISSVSTSYQRTTNEKKYCNEIRDCLNANTSILTLGETVTFVKNFSVNTSVEISEILQRHCIITLTEDISLDDLCKKSGTSYGKLNLTSSLLYLSKWHVKKDLSLSVLIGNHCNLKCHNPNNTAERSSSKGCPFNDTVSDNCTLTCLNTHTTCSEAIYDTDFCSNKSMITNKYFINITESNNSCYNCHNPVIWPEEKISVDPELVEDIDDPSRAVYIMKEIIFSLISGMNGSSVEVVMGEVIGTIVTQEKDVDFETISFGYTPESSSNIIEGNHPLLDYSTSVSLPKEAFEQANAVNGTQVPFAAVFRFVSMAKDELNSSILHNETIAVEMGVPISNLTDKIRITYRHVKEKGIPSCRSWNGEGSLPNWTDEGCLTLIDKDNINCECTHLTFFAVLMTTPTISDTDLNSLTYITYIGCGLSVFFLVITLFMHFMRLNNKANKSTTVRLLMQLFLAMLLLNLTFLTNKSVAELKSHVGCVIMAGVMHYSLLATFTWFAVEAFHLCLQLYKAGKVTIKHYVLKVSIFGWVPPIIVVTTIYSLGKYGEQVIITEDNTQVTMCWITDIDVHYFVNVGYYAVVFLFTFTTFVVVLRWLCYIQRGSARAGQMDRSRTDIWTVLGLCCMLGITWGFAFFAHGVLQVPAYYIFTILNSFQGFFLFLYYYTRLRRGDGNNDKDNEKQSCTTTTIQTNVAYENPYFN